MRLMRSRRHAWLVAGSFFTLLLTCLPAGAQDILGAITGSVKDSSGAVIPDVTVKAHNAGTNEETTAHTDANGFYSALNLPIGAYTVTFSPKQDFRLKATLRCW